MSNQEQGIAQSQIAADQSRLADGGGLQDSHAAGVSNLSERILLYLGVIAFLGLLVVWATASSNWILYGSLALAIILVMLWGWLRIRRIGIIKQQRAKQVAALQANADSNSSAGPR